MEVSVTDDKERFSDLVRHADAGDEIILTRRGQAAVRLIPVKAATTPAVRRKLPETVQANAAIKASAVLDAKHSQDFLYTNEGLSE